MAESFLRRLAEEPDRWVPMGLKNYSVLIVTDNVGLL